MQQELQAASIIANHYNVDHKIIGLPWLKELTNCSLVNESIDPPNLQKCDLDDAVTHETAKAVWVPNRNGIFINIAASFAESIGANMIVTGFNAEEAITFPDNSLSFISSINKSLSHSTLTKVKVTSYTQALNKRNIVELAREKNIPIWLCWSCYLGNASPCGNCESCQRLNRAINNSGSIEWYKNNRQGTL